MLRIKNIVSALIIGVALATAAMADYGLYGNRLYILTDGKTGIGNTAPTTQLDVTGVITATGGSSTNWNDAYGWGNHALAGYALSADAVPYVGATKTVTLGANALLVGSDANLTDFPKATAVFSAGNSGHSYAERVGVVGESVGEVGIQGIGVGGVATTNGYFAGYGLFGRALVSASGDGSGAVAIKGASEATHAGGSNIGIYSIAQNGALNYSFYGEKGNIYNNGGLTITGYATLDSVTFGDSSRQTTAAIPLSQNYLIKEPSGFQTPESVIVTYDATSRRIFLSGDVKVYWRGQVVPSLVSGYVSPTHDATVGTWFLEYDDNGVTWTQTPWTFDKVQIAYVFYGNQKIAFQETHGLMQWQAHKTLHETVGTYLHSGGDLTGITLNSTTAGLRRPLISTTEVQDEDLQVTVPQLATASYVHYYLHGANSVASFELASAEIVAVNGAVPYYNQFTGGAWQQTPMSNNNYQAIFLVVLPVTTSTGSQVYRYLWVQGQSQSSTLSVIQGLTPASVNLNGLTGIAQELIFVQRVIIRYTGGNWVVTQTDKLTGNKFNQTAQPSGSFLSAVSTDDTLTGVGTVASPLGVNTVSVEMTARKGVASGYASLDATARMSNAVLTRVSSEVSNLSPTINTNNYDMFVMTGVTADVTSINVTGSPLGGQKLWIAITGTGARALTFGTSFEDGAVTLPTTTVTTTRLDIGFIWNSATNKWRCMAKG